MKIFHLLCLLLLSISFSSQAATTTKDDLDINNWFETEKPAPGVKAEHAPVVNQKKTDPEKSDEIEVIDITSQGNSKVKVLINPITLQSTNDNSNINNEIAAIIASDLNRSKEVSGYNNANLQQKFNIISFTLNKKDFTGLVDKSINFVINSSVEKQQDPTTGQMKYLIKYDLIDTMDEIIKIRKTYKFSAESLRKTAHVIANQIYKYITGSEGAFDGKILFVSEAGSIRAPSKYLSVIDQDGHLEKILSTMTNDIVMSPRYIPYLDAIVFVSYRKSGPRLYLFNFKTGTVQSMSSFFDHEIFNRTTFSPNISYDGNKMVFSAIKNGDTDIYLANFENMSIERLTSSDAIETSPSLSSDGNRMVFISDEDQGHQHMYIQEIGGLNIFGSKKKIGLGRGGYGSPVWSPDGKYIAFIKIFRGMFHLCLIDTESDQYSEKILLSSYLIENPTWSPDGNYLLFSKKDRYNRPSNLFVLNMSTYNVNMILTSYGAVDASWVVTK